MVAFRLIVVQFLIATGVLSAEWRDLWSAPPGVLERAKELDAKKDYAGIEAMIAQIDAQYANNHNPEYFRSLRGILTGMDRDNIRPFDYAQIWLRRKLKWKILLTPYTRMEDARAVQFIKFPNSNVASPMPWDDMDRDQFIALRNDAVALLKTYYGRLRSHIVPGYQPKPVLQLEAYPDVTTAQGKRLYAQLVQDEYENTEQDELRKSLRLIGPAAASLVRGDFSWPPYDDATVNDLLDTLPSDYESKEKVLSDLARLREQHVLDLREEVKRKAALERAESASDGK